MSCHAVILSWCHAKKKSDAHPALDLNIVENESLDNVGLHDGQAGPGTAAAGVVHVAASTRRQGW